MTKHSQSENKDHKRSPERSSIADNLLQSLRVPLLALSSMLAPQAATITTTTLAGATGASTAHAQDEKPRTEEAKEKLKSFLGELATENVIDTNATRSALKAINEDVQAGRLPDAREALGWCARLGLLQDDAASLASHAALEWNNTQDGAAKFSPQLTDFLERRAAEWSKEKSAANILALALSENQTEREIYRYLLELAGPAALEEVRSYLGSTQTPSAPSNDTALDLVQAPLSLYTAEKQSDSTYATERLLPVWNKLAEIERPGKDAVIRTVVQAFLRPDDIPWRVKAEILAAAPAEFHSAAMPAIAATSESRRQDLLPGLPDTLRKRCEELSTLIQKLPGGEPDTVARSAYMLQLYEPSSWPDGGSDRPTYLHQSFDQIPSQPERAEYLLELSTYLSKPRYCRDEVRLYSSGPALVRSSVGDINRILRDPGATQLSEAYRTSPMFNDELASKRLAALINAYTSGKVGGHEFTLHLINHNLANPLTTSAMQSEPLLRTQLQELKLSGLWNVVTGSDKMTPEPLATAALMFLEPGQHVALPPYTQRITQLLISCAPISANEFDLLTALAQVTDPSAQHINWLAVDTAILKSVLSSCLDRVPLSKTVAKVELWKIADLSCTDAYFEAVVKGRRDRNIFQLYSIVQDTNDAHLVEFTREVGSCIDKLLENRRDQHAHQLLRGLLENMPETSPQSRQDMRTKLIQWIPKFIDGGVEVNAHYVSLLMRFLEPREVVDCIEKLVENRNYLLAHQVLSGLLKNIPEPSPTFQREMRHKVIQWMNEFQDSGDHAIAEYAADFMSFVAPGEVLYTSDPVESINFLVQVASSATRPPALRAAATIRLSKILREMGSYPEFYEEPVRNLQPQMVSTVLGEISLLGEHQRSCLTHYEFKGIITRITHSELSADVKSAFREALRTINLPQRVAAAGAGEIPPETDNHICLDWRDTVRVEPLFPAIILPQMLQVMADETVGIENRKLVLGGASSEALNLREEEIQEITKLGQSEEVMAALTPYLECLTGKKPSDVWVMQLVEDHDSYWPVRIAVGLHLAGDIPTLEPTVLAAFKRCLLTVEVKPQDLIRARSIPELKACMRELYESGNLFARNHRAVERLLEE